LKEEVKILQKGEILFAGLFNLKFSKASKRVLGKQHQFRNAAKGNNRNQDLLYACGHQLITNERLPKATWAKIINRS